MLIDAPDLSLRDLLAIVAVAEHAHFGRAAAALRIAQPTLSAQVKKVERALGVVLFDRSGRKFSVTPEGHRALPFIRDILGTAGSLVAGLDGRSAAQSPLRVGIIPTLGPYLLPHLLVPSSPPIPELTLCEQVTSELLRQLIDGTLDCAIVSLPIRHAALECFPLFDESFLLIAPRSHHILEHEVLSPNLLSVSEMVLLEEGHCFRDQAMAVCGSRRTGSPKLLTASLETLKLVVAAGGGYSLLPRLAAQPPGAVESRLVIRPFSRQAPLRTIVLCVRRSSPRHQEVHELAGLIRSRLPPSVKVVGQSEGRPRAGRVR